MGKYYINEKGEKKEGYYQNLIAKRYSLFSKPGDDFVIFDKELVIGYEYSDTKWDVTRKLKQKYEDIASELQKRGENASKTGKRTYPQNIKIAGDELDFVGLNKNGDIVLLELKRFEDTPKIYLCPMQIGLYDDILKKHYADHFNDFGNTVIEMIWQKRNLD